jgi:hypothetical protein
VASVSLSYKGGSPGGPVPSGSTRFGDAAGTTSARLSADAGDRLSAAFNLGLTLIGAVWRTVEPPVA